MSLLDGLREDLIHPDPLIAGAAIKKAEKVLSWLCASSQMPDDERLRILAEKIGDMSVEDRFAALKAGLQKPTGKPGRRRERGPDAVRAFTLYLRTDKTWRQIAYEVNGPCGHECPACGDMPRLPHTYLGIRGRKKRSKCPDCGYTLRKEAQKQRVCFECADALRSVVGELEKFLRDEGVYPTVPRRFEPALQ